MGSLGDKNIDSKSNKGKHRRGNSGSASWHSVNPNLIRTAICASVDDGGALLFGLTSDKGALVVRVYGEGSPYSEYFGPHDDVEGWLGAYAVDHGFTLGEGVK